MRRLRHPIRAIREPFGTAGLIVACVALIAALGGTAFAAAKLNGTQKKEVEKIAKKFAGKPGANGAQGPAGAAGANGKDGAAGLNGTNGTNGTNGASVTSVELGPGDPNCAAGGSEFKVGSGTPTYACNGEPGTFGDPLPSGKTETGTWGGASRTRLSYSENGEGKLEQSISNSTAIIPISFAAPVESAPQPLYVDLEGPPVAGCPGLENGLPTAEPGKLCVYQSFSTVSATPSFSRGSEFFGPPGADSAGTEMLFTCSASSCLWAGVWAVTAE